MHLGNHKYFNLCYFDRGFCLVNYSNVINRFEICLLVSYYFLYEGLSLKAVQLTQLKVQYLDYILK